MKRGHDINPEEIAVERIAVSPIHCLDLKTMGEEKTTQLIITIGHLMRRIPPKPAGIEHIGSGQDQPPSLVQEIINVRDKSDPFFKPQMFDNLKKKDNVKRLSNFLHAVKIMELVPVNIHTLINQLGEMAFQALLKISV
jgi:hypothetical protein